MDTNYVLGPDGELYHWGIKGMKWGVRRYQNKDGSLTNAGKKRYDKLEAEMEKLGGKVGGKTSDGSGKTTAKAVKDMSDEELNRAVQRARLESEYNRLQPKSEAPKQESILKRLSKQALNDVLVPSIMNAGKSYIDKTLSKYTKPAEPTVDDLLKKYGDMSEEQRKRYQNAAAVKTWENTLLGKKSK